MTNDFFLDLLNNQILTKGDVVKTDNQFLDELSNLLHEIPIYTPNYEVEYKRPIYPIRKYHHRRISNETTSIFNKVFGVFSNSNLQEEYYLQYQKYHDFFSEILFNIRDYIEKNQITTKHYLNPEYNVHSDQAYIIFYLKANIIMLLMEIQDQFGHYSTNDILNIEEIYEFYFNESPPQKPLIISTKNKHRLNNKKIEKIIFKHQNSYGYKEKNSDALLSVLRHLQLRIDLVNESISSIEELHKLLMSKDFTLEDTNIYLSCETTQFSYIIRQLKPFFTKFNPTMIDISGKFYSKKGILIKKSNLYKNSVDNTKEKTEIDKIIKQLQ